MDANRVLIALSESDRTDFGRVAFAEQSDAQKVFSAIWELESQVCRPASGDFWPDPSMTPRASAPHPPATTH